VYIYLHIYKSISFLLVLHQFPLSYMRFNKGHTQVLLKFTTFSCQYVW